MAILVKWEHGDMTTVSLPPPPAISVRAFLVCGAVCMWGAVFKHKHI